MTLTRMLTAAGCAALLGGTAALAGDPTATSDQTMQQPMHSELQKSKSVQYSTPAGADPRTAAAQELGVDASALVQAPAEQAGTASMELVTNGPIPDTPENRAQYGGPNSRAGKMTTPRGN